MQTHWTTPALRVVWHPSGEPFWQSPSWPPKLASWNLASLQVETLIVPRGLCNRTKENRGVAGEAGKASPTTCRPVTPGNPQASTLAHRLAVIHPCIRMRWPQGFNAKCPACLIGYFEITQSRKAPRHAPHTRPTVCGRACHLLTQSVGRAHDFHSVNMWTIS